MYKIEEESMIKKICLGLALLLSLSGCGISGNTMKGVKEMQAARKDEKVHINARFIRAIQDKRFEQMKECVEQGADINHFSTYTRSIAEYNSHDIPLVEASNQASDYKTMLYLIDQGANTDFIIEPKGRTSLMLAGDQTNLLEAMLDYGADINKKGTEKYLGQTALDELVDFPPRDLLQVYFVRKRTATIELFLQKNAEVTTHILESSFNHGWGGMIYSRKLIDYMLDAGQSTGLNRTLQNAILGMDAAVIDDLKNNSVGDVNPTYLLQALAIYGSAESLDLALEKYPDVLPSAPNRILEHYMISTAAYVGNASTLRYLMEQGYDQTDDDDDSFGNVGMQLCAGNQTKLLRYWLENGESVYDTKSNKKMVKQMFENAAAHNNVEILNLLLENGFVLTENNYQYALQYALVENSIEAVDFLYNKSKELFSLNEDESQKILVDALSGAIMLGRNYPNNNVTVATVDYMLALGVDINGPVNWPGSLLDAIRYALPEHLEYFLQKGVDFDWIDANQGKSAGPLMKASQNGDLEAIKLYIQYGANIDVKRTPEGTTALMDSAGSVNITRYLLEQGADPNAIDNKNLPVLAYAIGWQNESVVKLLLENGADPTVTDHLGDTLLDVAKIGRNEEIIAMIKQGMINWENK